MPKISIITPCYYNELNIKDYFLNMFANETNFPENVSFEYIMVDDGSKDNTWNELVKAQNLNPKKIKILKLLKNYSSTNAVFSALPYVTGDCVVIISADLQDPPELILEMYNYWESGYKLVLANRISREEPFMQKLISNTTHFLIKKFGLKNLPKGGFDLNLFDIEISKVIQNLNEQNSFFPFLLIWLGYEYINIPYTRRKRKIGKSSYSLSKKIKAFVDSFVAFSFFPIRLISIIGLSFGFFAFIYSIFILYNRFTGSIVSAGWSSLMILILLVSSFQMISLGIIGEYVWRNLESSRNRPRFIIEKKILE